VIILEISILSLRKWRTFLQFVLSSLFFMGCAGPTSPFGAMDTLSSIEETLQENLSHLLPSEKKYSKPQFKISPDFQVLHKKSPLVLTINDPQGIPDDFHLRVYFNGYEITSEFYNNSEISFNLSNTEVTFEHSTLRFLAGKDSLLQFSYERTEGAGEFITNYSKPPCDVFAQNQILTTKPFRVKQLLIDEIEVHASRSSINPSLVAGLIAQESGFNPRAVSWSKAVGLTQVTPIANKEIIDEFSEWPQSEQISRLPAAALKYEIRKGNITADEDWRLESSKSIQGGVKYLEYLVGYWGKKQKKKDLLSVYPKHETPLTDVILSSYNSGASRVNYALRSMGRSYLKSDQLNEARYYVDRVKSYCYHFSSTDKQESL
jgi:hypothetical protein